MFDLDTAKREIATKIVIGAIAAGAGAVTANTGTDIIYPIVSPGAVASITGQDIANIAVGTSAVLVGTVSTPGPLSKVARGVEDGSLGIPTTIAIP